MNNYLLRNSLIPRPNAAPWFYRGLHDQSVEKTVN